MAFNAKELLKYALDKLSPDEVAALLEKSDIVFGIQGTYGKYAGGVLKTEQGGTIQGGIGAITGVKTVESYRDEQAKRSTLPPEEQDAAKRQEQIDAQTRASSDPKLATTSTLLGGGVAPVTTSPVKGQPGMRVLGGNVSGNDHNRQDNIATGGLATAGHDTINKADEAGQDETVQTPKQQGQNQDQAEGEAPKGAEGEAPKGAEGEAPKGAEGTTVSPDEAKRLAEQARRK
jgi:hypothetical protein